MKPSGRRPVPPGTESASGPAADAVVLYDKPAGTTSHDIVARIRRTLPDQPAGARRLRVGHAGTLDPFATGLLLILVGRSTRVQRYLMALPKRYEVVARLGWRSCTGDPEGPLEHTGRIPLADAVLPTGPLLQAPPAYSAVKVDGERAYRRARRGEDVRPEPRPVHVHRFLERWRDGDRAGYVIECAAGTYVRTLIAELGDAYCLELRRTAIGPFHVADADPDRPMTLDDALSFLPRCCIDAEHASAAGHGRGVPGRAEGPVRLVGPDGLVAIAEPRGDLLWPVVGLRP